MGISGMGYVVIGSTDLECWRQFATQVLGMAALDGPDGELYLKMDSYHHRYLIVPYARNELIACGWEVADKAAFEAAVATFSAQGLAIEIGDKSGAKRRWVQEFAAVTDPSGNRVEVFWGPVSDFERFVSPIGVSGFVTEDMGMGHIVLPAPRFEATRDFWLESMHFGISDFVNYDMGAGQPPVRICFMHCNNPRQHSVALVEMEHPAKCDHLLVEVENFDELGRGLYRAEDHEIPLQVTLGRHINDDMVSFYMYSPAGFTIEYGTGGKRIEDWSKHRIFQATRGSHWGHRFVAGHRDI